MYNHVVASEMWEIVTRERIVTHYCPSTLFLCKTYTTFSTYLSFHSHSTAAGHPLSVKYGDLKCAMLH